MLDNERATLKQNAEVLANLLTENVPYLLSHYLAKDVLTESEREAIISADSSQAIKIKLLDILADKEGISLDAVIDGLNATENQCVSKEIKTLLSDNKPSDDAVDNGSGDKIEEVSLLATNLVDEVIAKAEEKTNSMPEQQSEDVGELVEDEPAPAELDDSTAGAETIATISDHSPSAISHISENANENNEEGEKIQTSENLVEASVEVHKTEEEVSPPEEVQEEQVDTADVPDRKVSFQNNVATVIEDRHPQDEEKEEAAEEKLEEKQSVFANSTQEPEPEIDYKSHGVDAQIESENEDVDNIDIEKEFVMPAEAETNNNDHPEEQSKVTNGGRFMTRMESNDIILDDEDETRQETSSPSTGDEGLDSIMARKALVRQQVQKFEKTTPGGPGVVKYSIRSSSAKPEPPAEAKSDGSNVKNLKNFFQRLSTTTDTTSSPPSGPAKPVGKLKVTFPAS